MDKANTGVSDSPPQCDAFFAILSTARNSKIRDAIREGWLSDAASVFNRFSFQYKFFIGWDKLIGSTATRRIVEFESAIHNDIVVLPFIDSYYNLTAKVGLLLKYSESNFRCQYIFKIDDDVRISGIQMADLIDDLSNSKKDLVYGGYVYDQINRVSSIIRSNTKHGISYDDFPYDHFKPYAGGPLYFMTRQLVESLSYTIVHRQLPNGLTETVPSYYFSTNHDGLYKLEDAFFGFMIWNMSQTMKNITIYHVRNIWDKESHNCVPPYLSTFNEKRVDMMRLWYKG
jgi:hypothetical protein